MADIDEGRGPGGGFPEPADIPSELPILALKNVVVFPSVVLPIHVSRDKSIQAIEAVVNGQRIIGLLTQKDEDVDEPTKEDLYEVGTIGLILRVLKLPEGGVRILIQGLSRYRVKKWLASEPFFRAEVEPLPEDTNIDIEIEALMRSVNEQFRQYVTIGKSLPAEILTAAANMREPGKLADLIAANIAIGDEQRQEILETIPTTERLTKVNEMLVREIQLLQMSSNIQRQVQEEVGKNQRDYFLREQMKAIQRELGESDPKEQEQREYDEKIEKAQMPDEVEKKAREELQRLERMHPDSAESGVIRTYLEVLCALPWAIESEDSLDIEESRRILDEDHYGLDEVKERLLEFLGVHKLKKNVRGPILCLVGPPGVGKTSLGRSVARAMGRKFVRMSLGGVRDEAEIRGHRRTYVGAMPGRIMQSLRQANTRNPVMMLDEIDKLGSDAFRGDPSSALLEALDPEQNFAFSDHYLEVPFDLSNVLFVATANVLDTIPAPLRDRMEVIRLAGYTELEKVKIIQRFLMPKQMENHGLPAGSLKISPAMLRVITTRYTREAGLRNCEREIAKICRKAALKIAEGQAKKINITSEELLKEYLGPQRFTYEEVRRADAVGVVTGLVWTSAGGDIQVIEASAMPGKGQLILTGQLGDVMKESCRAALTYCRSHADMLGIQHEKFKEMDIHLHFPAGAIPKDGPSAGITIAVAIISLFTGKKVNSKLAMTGEISLKGRVLPVGGLKEKILGAKRAGVKHVILPQANEKDIEEIDEEVTGGIQISYVDHLNDVVDIVFPTVKRSGSDTVEKETLRGSVVQPTQNGKRPLPRPAPAKGKTPAAGKQPARRSTDASA